MRAFHELDDADAVGVGSNRVVIAASRLGFATSGATAFAEAPIEFYASPVTAIHVDGDGAALITNEACEAWLAQCVGGDCGVGRLSTSGQACNAATVDRGVWVGAGFTRTVSIFDRARGAVGVIALASRREGSLPVAEDVDQDAIVIAGPPSDPWLRRVALPPTDATSFASWVAARTNVVIDAHGAPTVSPER
jgi:hypothetical protein